MFNRVELTIRYGSLWCFAVLAVVTTGCYDPGALGEYAAVESPESALASPKTLYLGVHYDDSTYQITYVKIIDSAFVQGPIIKIYGTYGVEIITDNDEVSFAQYTWMQPIDGIVKLPFSDDTALIEFIHRTGGGKVVIGRFSRGDILSAGT